ncbi:hypothetical protein ILUMI_23993 [Ignelater luminosus]|uniref:Peptidase S1 domain-containing protein n=1 Tax=Ignelater luminosus TaxID=2038154 RepID=A0A8K0CBE8_IGNLU|nr:hypothetical protein ILUMI_23993 [Ignelater luminosus]
MKDFLQVFLAICLIKSAHTNLLKIVGGEVATKGQFLFYVELRVSQSQTIAYNCGGTLIHPKWILSAAQCFEREHVTPSMMFALDLVRAYMGSEKTVQDLNDINFIIRYVEKAYVHSKYTYDTNRDVHSPGARHLYDIAVAVLKQPYQLNQYIKTIKLPSAETQLCSKGIIIGSGQVTFLLEDPTYKSRQIRYAYLHIKPVNKLFGKPPVSRETAFFSEMENVKVSDLGFGSFGDQGSPYLCDIGSGWVQYGVFSGYYTSSKSKNYGYFHPIYESVDKHMGFIRSHVPLQSYDKHWRMREKHKYKQKDLREKSNSMRKRLSFMYLFIVNLYIM